MCTMRGQYGRAARAGTTTSQDAFRGIQLPTARPSVGLGMVGGGHNILIHRDSRLPAEAQQIFTTLHDAQDTVRAGARQSGKQARGRQQRTTSVAWCRPT